MSIRDQRQFASFAEFWPHYVLAHQNPKTYGMHALGIVLAIFFALGCLWFAAFFYLPIAVLIGYGFAIPSHFLFEGNRPASTYAPLYSFAADFRLTYYVLTGQVQREITRFRLQSSEKSNQRVN